MSILGLVLDDIGGPQRRQFNIMGVFVRYIFMLIGVIRLGHASLRVRFRANYQNSQRSLSWISGTLYDSHNTR